MAADSIKQNKDRDRLVKGCFQSSKTENQLKGVSQK